MKFLRSYHPLFLKVSEFKNYVIRQIFSFAGFFEAQLLLRFSISVVASLLEVAVASDQAALSEDQEIHYSKLNRSVSFNPKFTVLGVP